MTEARVQVLAIVAALAISAGVAHERTGIDLAWIALVAASAGTLLVALEAALGRGAPLPRPTLALVLFGVVAEIVVPARGVGHAIVASAALGIAARPTPGREPGTVEQILVLALGLGPAAAVLLHFQKIGPELAPVLPAALVLAARTRGAFEARVAGLAVAGAAALAIGGAAANATQVVLLAAAITAPFARDLRAPEPRFAERAALAIAVVGADLLYRGSFDLEVSVLATAAIAFAVGHAERLPVGARRAAWVILVVIAVTRPMAWVPLPIVEHGGRGLAYLATIALAVLVFFAVARSLTKVGEGPGAKAQAIATLLAVWVVVEGGLRVKQETGFDFVDPSFSPGVPFASGLDDGKPEKKDYWDHTFLPKKPAGTFRIVLLGGSSAYGIAQHEREKALAGQLEARLSLLTKSTPEVLCLALPGYTSDQELAVVLGHANGWQVDLFLAVDAYNDLAYLSLQGASPGEIYSWKQHRFGLGFPIERWIARRSLIAQRILARKTVRRAEGTRDYFEQRPNGFYIDGIARNEEAIAILARDEGAAFAWTEAPVAYEHPEHGPEALKGGRHGPEVLAREDAIRKSVEPVVKERGGICLELRERLEKRRETAKEVWFTDECHYTDRGMAVIAEEIAGELAAKGVVPP